MDVSIQKEKQLKNKSIVFYVFYGIMELGENMFERFKLLVDDKFDEITKKTVLVIGLGGVGSYTVESLVRSGIQNIIIVDGDIIDISNLNRQLMTNYNNIGEFKTKVWYNRIKSINPSCEVTVINQFIDKHNIDELFKYHLDYVVDACDTVSTKVLIMEKCHQLGIKLVMCMGTGNKLDPSKLNLVDIHKTSYDPLAKVIRKKCRELGIKKQMVVCSTEKPIKDSITTIPSCSFVPATAGLLMTSYIINDIVGDLDV